jgi:aspartate aminotransferase
MEPFQLTLNPILVSMPRAATLEINEESKRLIASGKNVYKLGFGQSPFPVPKVCFPVYNRIA